MRGAQRSGRAAAWAAVAAVLASSASWRARTADSDLRKELDEVKKQLDGLRGVKEELEAVKKEKAAAKAPIAAAAAKAENRYGPNAAITAKQGKVSIGGLVQVWYYSIQNDNVGFYGNVTPTAPGGGDSNEGRDNDSFSIRRAEINFTVDINENVTALVKVDPARPIKGRPSFPSNVGLFSTKGVSATESDDVRNPDFNAAARLFQDAYVNYHGSVPHLDFQIGQYKPWVGEEGVRSSGALDFVERSMLGQLGDKRDLGVTAHGTWWDDRFQYWLGAIDNAGDFFGTRGEQQNRVDDNDRKDFTWRLLVRPVWKNETWGSLELGASGQHGVHGEAGGPTRPGGTVDGLNRRRTNANRYFAWGSYKPGGPVKGLWFKGECAWIEDRAAPGSIASFTNAANTTLTGFATNTTTSYLTPHPFSVTGFYAAAGYKISDSVFKDRAPQWLKNFEFALRYEEFGNILVADLKQPNSHTDAFSTKVWTPGINYYIKGDNAKIQINYNMVDDPDANSSVTRTLATVLNRPRHFRGVNNNNLLVNFQAAW
ncbi:MAG: hypothetical protein HY291_13660 [Planctomycetes bacterium]|nr:hypothetical protein [Planctomycetota bacterium]